MTDEYFGVYISVFVLSPAHPLSASNISKRRIMTLGPGHNAGCPLELVNDVSTLYHTQQAHYNI